MSFKNLGLILAAIFIVYFTINGFEQNIFQQNTWDLSTTSGRELASIEKPVSPYNVKKCGELKHTDGDILTFCIVTFNGTSGGFYDANKSLMVVGSFSETTLVHEIFHAASIHNYKKGFTDMLGGPTQEKMAYDAENILMQIRAFQEDMNIMPDLSDEKKNKLGIPLSTDKVFASNNLNNIENSVKDVNAKENLNNKKVKNITNTKTKVTKKRV